MGLHVDPVSLDPKISIRDAEVRRRIWWTVAGLDALLCLSFGRPSVINFYKTNLPQDREDETLSDAPGTANMTLPPSNVLNNETTEMTYHTAYFQLAIPSYELLDRLFHVDRKYSRSAIYGWFRPAPEAYAPKNLEDDEGHTYDGALRLAKDILIWYSHLPRGMRFDVDEDTAEAIRKHSVRRINQILALCVKTFMIVYVMASWLLPVVLMSGWSCTGRICVRIRWHIPNPPTFASRLLICCSRRIRSARTRKPQSSGRGGLCRTGRSTLVPCARSWQSVSLTLSEPSSVL
jgi:hypothetical protein